MVAARIEPWKVQQLVPACAPAGELQVEPRPPGVFVLARSASAGVDKSVESRRCPESPVSAPCAASVLLGPDHRVSLWTHAEQFAAGDNTRRLHLGSLRSPSVRLAGVAPELNAVRRHAALRGASRGSGW